MSQASQNTKPLPPPKEKAAFGSEEEFIRFVAEHSAADQKCRADCQSFEALANEMIRQLEELLQQTHLDKKQLAPLASKLLNRANEIASLLLSMEQTKPPAPRQIPAGQEGNPYLMLLDTLEKSCAATSQEMDLVNVKLYLRLVSIPLAYLDVDSETKKRIDKYMTAATYAQERLRERQKLIKTHEKIASLLVSEPKGEPERSLWFEDRSEKFASMARTENDVQIQTQLLSISKSLAMKSTRHKQSQL